MRSLSRLNDENMESLGLDCPSMLTLRTTLASLLLSALPGNLHDMRKFAREICSLCVNFRLNSLILIDGDLQVMGATLARYGAQAAQAIGTFPA